MKFSGRTILVVGAGSGLGKELVRHLLHLGNRIIAFSRKAPEVWGSQGSGNPHPGRGSVVAVGGDVRQAKDVERLFRTIKDSGERLDGVFYCSGVSRPDYVEEPDVERALDTVSVNFEGAFRIFYAALPLIRNRPEAFLAGFTSMAGDRGVSRAHAYSSSKAALDRLLECLRIDLWDVNINVFTIVPGYVETPMTAQNRFPMPGIWPLSKSVSHIIRRMEAGDLVIRFPWYHSLGMKLLNLLPNRLYWGLMSRSRCKVKISTRPDDGFKWRTDI
ncbi:hypothetical protein AUK22_01870 [bacterium CG2_30_54_10]|nr:MAG: hypothetical protein AUK22_01870 [bacterium CG2_30_54_10]